MPTPKRPGVYFEEVLGQAQPVAAANLSAAAFVGGNPRGPVTPKLVTSWQQFVSNFGGFWSATDYLPYAVFEFFTNGGREAYVCRVTGTGAAAALATLKDASGAGGANEVQTVTITGAPTGGTFTLTFSGETTAGIAYNATTAAVVAALEALPNIAVGEVAVAGGPLPGTAVTVTFQAGLGKRDQPQMTASGAGLTGGITPAVAVTTTTPGAEGGVNTLRVTAANPGTWAGGTGAVAGRDTLYVDVVHAGTDKFSLIVHLGGAGAAYVVERWLDLSMVSTDARYAPSVVNAGSTYIVVTDLASPSASPTNRPLVQAGTALSGGSNGAAAGDSDITTALSLFDSVDRPLNLNIPGNSTAGTINAATNYAAGRGDVFVVADPPEDIDPAAAVAFAGTLTASSFGALYYPWINISDPNSAASGTTRKIPPGGAVIGQYAQTDVTRGVFKTPAGIGTRLGGAIGVERILKGTDLDSLNEAGVNALRQIPGAGTVIMGGRTLKPTGSDKYVAVRRSIVYIRSSLIESTRFAIFEPNDERLWLTIRSIIERFLLDFWQRGGLRGTSADEAFFVKCDDELNTPQSIAAGEVKIQIGVALQFPAEFVLINLSQREVGATVAITV